MDPTTGLDPTTGRRPVRVLLVDAAPMQRSGLRVALTGSTARPDTPGLGTVAQVSPGPRAAGLATVAQDSRGPGATGLGTATPGSQGPGTAGFGTASIDRGPAAAGGDSGGEIVVAGEASDGVEAVDLARRLLPDVLIADLVLPRADGLAVTRAVVTSALPVRVLILADHDGDEHVLAAIAAGAAGFLRKDVPATELLTAVRAIARGGAVIAPLVLARILARVAEALPAPETTTTSALDALTDREREVLVHVARGHSNAEIARALQVSETTIKTHVGHVLTKLRLRDRTQAVVLAYETGLIKPGS